MIVNAAQAQAWNGPTGEHWADHHDRYDTMAAGFDGPLFEAAELRATSRVLDIGCGTGATTRRAARQARDGEAVGVDLSAPMLARARELAAAEGLANATFEQGDAQTQPFAPGRFDVVISRAGVMFFADPVAAFTNLRRALTPGGRLAFVTHRSIDGRFQALADVLPPVSRPRAASFADPDYGRQVLTGAGFRDVAAAPVEVPSVLGRDADDVTGFLFGGALPDAVRESRAAVHQVLREHERDGSVRLLAVGMLYTALS